MEHLGGQRMFGGVRVYFRGGVSSKLKSGMYFAHYFISSLNLRQLEKSLLVTDFQIFTSHTCIKSNY